MDGRRWVIRESAWLRSFPQGAEHAWTEIPMRKIRDVLRLSAAGMSRHVEAQDCRQPGGERDSRPGLHLAGAAGRPHLAISGRPGGRSAGAPALPAVLNRQAS
jgi:hypothetical protein